jgi:UDP-N-acetyl-D-galactosamine dehydrogenase
MERGIAVIGLGYVGLPLALALARHFDPVFGFDISVERIDELRRGIDHTGESTAEELARAKVRFTGCISELRDCSAFILAVPTPIDGERRPDLQPLLSACRTVGPIMRPGAVVIIESTVYPGLTRDVCGPALAAASGLRSGIDFHLGYSPERINPGDRQRRLETIVKVIAGETPDVVERLATIYGPIVPAGLHRASSIEIAEAAKVIENVQRDVNIALMNELAMIFDQLNIPTREVLAAAATKWNFLPFVPGLVGGHCIGIDPYYLTARAEREGYHPHVILASRRLNDSVAAFVARRTIRLLSSKDRPLACAKVGILGLAFKENVPDLRNSRIPDICRELASYGVATIVHDPHVKPDDAHREYGLTLVEREQLTGLDGLILAVPHRDFLQDPEKVFEMVRPGGAIVDIKAALDVGRVPRNITYWSL